MSYVSYKGLFPIVTFFSTIPFLASCTIPNYFPAPRYRVANVEQAVEAIKKEVAGLKDSSEKLYSGLEGRVKQSERRPLAEVPIMLTKGRGYDLELGEIVGIAINKYENPDKRKIAEMVAAHPKGGVILVPTAGGKVLNVYFVLDVDGDGKHTFGVDRYATDITKGGQEVDAVKIEEPTLVERTRGLLIQIKSISK